MNPTAYLPVADYLPHAGRMVLLDQVVSAARDTLSATTTIRADAPFCDGAEVGGWVGVEYMAQTIAALAGFEARSRGDAVRVGFLVGTRRYDCSVPAFRVGQTLTVTATREFQADNGVAVMDCTIAIDGTTVARAQLSAYQPDNLDEYLNQA
ncbi:ApeP family dehydratase [Jeongeupia chitinilytica]|uniref:Thioester dehydrase n=1 Tax=Jeongeupia chitinilytica TaxID=1041641 RepID=A0ABQ3H3T0_9NEIS|nr:hotdog family protein [Jeongeupia chitinilytica]GHD69040.1 thioester dehydrase [Jeongeupia chitinilytica]